jgi:hypothetical protein
MTQTVSFTVLARSEQSSAQVFLPVGGDYQPFRFEQEVYEVIPNGPAMGFGSPSASEAWSPTKGK